MDVGTPPERGEEVEPGGFERRSGQERRSSAARSPSHHQWTPLGRALLVVGDHWTLAIAMQLSGGRTRLSALRNRLSGVSAAVLDRYLHRMTDAGLVTRTRFREMPPRVEVELTEAGRELLPIAAQLARWGRNRAWTEPRNGEAVDLDVLLRLLAELVSEPLDAPDALVELAIENSSEPSYRMKISEGRVRLLRDGEDAPPAEAVIRGDRDAWIDALGPKADIDKLELSGKRKLAELLLGRLVEAA
jgi:DNA-binding HxlR family transcriptional regulator